MPAYRYTRLPGLIPGGWLKIPINVTASKTSGTVVAQQNPEIDYVASPPGIAGCGHPGPGRLREAVLPAHPPVLCGGLYARHRRWGGGERRWIQQPVRRALRSVYAGQYGVRQYGRQPHAAGKKMLWMNPADYVVVEVEFGDANGLVADLYVDGGLVLGGP